MHDMQYRIRSSSAKGKLQRQGEFSSQLDKSLSDLEMLTTNCKLYNVNQDAKIL